MAHGKTKQGAKGKLRGKSREQDRKRLPPDKQREKNQAEQGFQVLFKQRLGHEEKSEGDANDKKQAEKARKNQSDEIKTAVLVAQAVAEDPPAKPGDKSNLIGAPGHAA
jgi:hypothetical protein